MNWYLEVLKKYAVFDGRARGKEFWYFSLFNGVAHLILLRVDRLVGTYSVESHLGLLSGIYFLATFMPAWAVSVRRMHDTGRSGWWILVGAIPLIG